MGKVVPLNSGNRSNRSKEPGDEFLLLDMLFTEDGCFLTEGSIVTFVGIANVVSYPEDSDKVSYLNQYEAKCDDGLHILCLREGSKAEKKLLKIN